MSEIDEFELINDSNADKNVKILTQYKEKINEFDEIMRKYIIPEN